MKIEVSQNPRMSPFGDSRQQVIRHNDFGASKAPAGLDLVHLRTLRSSFVMTTGPYPQKFHTRSGLGSYFHCI